MEGGFKDIDVRVFAPDRTVLFKEIKGKEDSFQFVASHSGPYKLCFGNKMSTIAEKEVNFNMYVGNSLEKQNAVREEHLAPLGHVITALAEGIRNVESSTFYIKRRQELSYLTNMSTDRRIFWFSMLETVSLIVMGAFQIFFIR